MLNILRRSISDLLHISSGVKIFNVTGELVSGGLALQYYTGEITTFHTVTWDAQWGGSTTQSFVLPQSDPVFCLISITIADTSGSVSAGSCTYKYLITSSAYNTFINWILARSTPSSLSYNNISFGTSTEHILTWPSSQYTGYTKHTFTVTRSGSTITISDSYKYPAKVYSPVLTTYSYKIEMCY